MSLLQMSFYGAVIILAVLLLRAATLHRLPKNTFLILWGIALLRLLVPFEIASGYSVYSVLPKKAHNTFDLAFRAEEETQPVYSVPTATPIPEYPVHTGIAVQSAENGLANADAPDFYYMPYITDQQFPGLPEESPAPSSVDTLLHNLTSALPFLWLAGSLLCVTFFAVSYIKCTREFRASLPVKEAYAAEWLKRHPLKRTITMRQSDRIAAPLTYGIFHPVILLPKSTDWSNTARLDYVLYHEFTHIRRLDLVAKLVMIAAVCLHWFNPVVWLMYIFFNRDLELSCDTCVVAHFAQERASYARTLIELEEQKSFVLPLYSHFSRNAVEERITSIMKSKKTTVGMVVLAVLLVVAIFITLGTSSVSANKGTPSGGNGTKPHSPTVTPLSTVTPTPTNVPPTATPRPTVTPILAGSELPTATPSPVPQDVVYKEFPTFPSEDAIVAEKGWDLAYVSNTEQMRFRSLREAGGIVVAEPSEWVNIQKWYSGTLDGICYFYMGETVAERNDDAWNIAITSPDYPLSGGAVVGMTEEELLKLYPDLAKTELSFMNADILALYDLSVWAFRADQFPVSFLAEYDYAYVACLEKAPDSLPHCIVFLIKNNQVGAITVYMPTAN